MLFGTARELGVWLVLTGVAAGWLYRDLTRRKWRVVTG